VPRMRIAAIQLEPVIADVEANLEACERLVDAAARDGAEWVILPEFFTTGVAFREELADAALAPDGAATMLLRDLAGRHEITTGGSYLCRDADGHVRNAFFLVGPDGTVLGRHDKDLPTMWENCFYVGGDDPGVIDTGAYTAGVALCWEFMRSQTAWRLRERVDLVVGGSGWWSIPEWPPKAFMRKMERDNARTAAFVAERFARLVGAPVAHAAHAGPIECPLPWTPLTYRGILQGGAVIADADGQVLDRREREAGEGHAIADVRPGRTEPADAIGDGFWLHKRGPIATALWNYQRAHGRRWYARHTQGRPPLDLHRRARDTSGRFARSDVLPSEEERFARERRRMREGA
jgi:predicted amidohydrolase